LKHEAISHEIIDEPQLLNEMEATDQEVGLLINFGREKLSSNVLCSDESVKICVNPWLKK